MSKWTPKFSKKKHVAHSIPEKSEAPEVPEVPEKKVKYVRGNIYGVFRYIKIKILFN